VKDLNVSYLALYLLGPPRVECDGQELHIARRKALALLAYLAVEPGRHNRDVLATLLWPDYDQSGARGRLRRTLSTLNRTLGEGWLAVDRETVGVNPDAGLWLDVDRFRKLLAAYETHDHPTYDACPDCLERLTEAAELYRSDFMSGFTLPDSLGFDEWGRYQAERLRDELSSVLERLSACHAAEGDYDSAIAAAQRWLELDPLRERAHRQLIELYARVGRRTAALRQYRQCVRLLEEELGVPPALETTALYERIRSRHVRQHKAEPIVSPSSTAPSPAFLRDDATPARAEQPVFVARERELAQLSGYLEKTLAGQGRVVFITGGPGRGKSTLMREFARRVMDAHHDLLAVMGNCNAYSGMGDPYLPFREVLAMLTGDVEGRWSAGVISTEQTRRLWDILPVAVQTLFDHDPHLIDIFLSGQALLSRALSATPEGAKWLTRLREWVGRERGDRSDLNLQYLFERYAHVLCDLALEHPLVLLLDDLQWVDGPSASLLFHLGRHLAEVGGRVLVVGTYRPEEVALGRDEKQHPLALLISEFKRRFGEVQVDLVQADEKMGRRFVDAFLDFQPNRLGAGFRAALSERTGGHPLFTVELLHAMRQQGDLVQVDSVWVEGPELDWEQIPTRVEAVIEARLGRLDEDLCDMLRVGSVEGEMFTAQVVAQVQGLPEREVLRALSNELSARHRLVRETGEDQVEATGRYLSRFQFSHALFQTYVYGRLSPGERRLLHGEVGAALEALYGDHSGSIAVPLAHHYAQTGERDKAAEYLAHAGDQARVTYAFEEAEAYYHRALELLSFLSSTEAPKTAWSRLQALKGLGLVHFASGGIGDAEASLREAIELGRELGVGSRELVRMYFWLGEVLYWQGRHDERRRIGEEGLALVAAEARRADGATAPDAEVSAEAEDPAEALESTEAALMLQLLATSGWDKEGWERYREIANRMALMLQNLPYTEELRPVYGSVVMAHWQDKDPGEMTQWLRLLEQHALEHHDLTALAASYAMANRSHRGDLRGDIRNQLQALAIFTKTGDRRYGGLTCAIIAEDLLYLGDLKDAEVYAGRALSLAEATGFKLVQARAHRVFGRVALCRGALEETVDACQAALEFLTPTDLDQHWRKDVISTLGRAHLAQRDREKAVRSFRQAIVLPGFDDFLGAPLAVLSGLEGAYADPEAFCAFCRSFREAHPQVHDLPTVQWFLEPAVVAAVRDIPLRNEQFAELVAPDWAWNDQYDDCSFCVTAGGGLDIHAANGRDLWAINLSAPRLMQNAPKKMNWAAQTVCGPASLDKPAIGGLLLWQDQENYLRLDRGTAGVHEIAFGGCLDNQDLLIGRGRLPLDQSDRVTLRLERIDSRVNALCSADGEAWFTVGHIEFPAGDPLQIGLHAIGCVDRIIYHGAYPDGTAIRFESFTLWELDP
jgi:DNA-binding SARP family transcriptional activator